jgi:hypothetical protein
MTESMELHAVIHGEHAAGPLVVDAADDGRVHVGWPGGGLWLGERQLGRLIVALVRAGCRPREDAAMTPLEFAELLKSSGLERGQAAAFEWEVE